MRNFSIFFLVAAAAASTSAAERPDAAALYQQHCAQCHGADLRGGNASSMVDGVWNHGTGTGSYKRNIKHGLTHMGMPAYEATLSDREIDALAEYISTAEADAGAVRPPIPDQIQTREYVIDVDHWVMEGLEIPWAIDFLDADTALVTERPGRLRVIKDGVLAPEPVSGTPEVLNDGQGGLLDVAVDPEYPAEDWIYLSFSHELHDDPEEKFQPAMTKVVRGKIRDNAWVDEQVVFEADHDDYIKTRHHYGSRIVFDPEHNLYFSMGERGMQEHAQVLDRPNGKAHRLHRDGSIPEDNPFADTPDAVASIFSYGNRNIQGMAVHPETGAIWATEHGPMGGDELNVLRAGKNYGWPVITYGRNYNGQPVSDQVAAPGMEQPTYFWNPSTGVCGLDFCRGDEFPKWQNYLLAGSLRYEDVTLLTIADERVLHAETIVKNFGRVRDVVCGPGGIIYVVLNNPDVIVRLRNAGEREY
ncbi:MAG: c-type cytochrome [Candidatus Hydrogenedens sp.]|nr:c-type cytochrome [Candidatus Hydrogenedens sp.]